MANQFRLKVLVADDDPVFQALARAALEGAGHAVTVVSDGADALEKLREPFDAAVIDLVMPKIDGFRLIALIRATPNMDGLPIIVLSSRNDVGAVEEAYGLGADGFETKPVNWSLFPTHLKHTVARSRLISELRAAARRAAHP